MTSHTPYSTLQLPNGHRARPATPDDLDAVFQLITDEDTHVLGAPDLDISELRDYWRAASLDDDTRVVEDAAGAIVGYVLAEDRTHVRPSAGVYVHPKAEGRGIGTWITRWLEERARRNLALAPEGARVAFQCTCSAGYQPALDLLANEGYAPERYFLRMTIDLAPGTPLAPPAWPDGVAVRTHVTGDDDEAVYHAVEESFSDHWGHLPTPYDQWRTRTVERREWFAPELWFLATAGDQIAGIALCSDYPDMGQGWVNTVGVRRPWRRQGVALALLQHAFCEFHRRGRNTVSLGVDAQSLTGATRVYEKAGMRVQHRFALFTKELRPGIEIATQTLSP